MIIRSHYYERKNAKELCKVALDKGWSYEMLAVRWGVSYATVARWIQQGKPVVIDDAEHSHGCISIVVREDRLQT